MAEEYDIRGLNLNLDVPSANGQAEVAELSLNETNFRLLYEQTSRPLLRYLMAITRRQDLAEDLLQETYCRFLTARLPDMDRTQMRSYLFRIATNLARDHWRRPAHEPMPEDRGEPSPSVSYLENRFGINQAFDRLKPRERQLLWLAYVEGSNHREIAASTGLRPGSIRLLLFRARRKFAKLMGSPTNRRHISE